MTRSRIPLGTLLSTLVLLVACGGSPEGNPGQNLPNLGADPPGMLVLGGGSAMNIIKPAITSMWGSSDHDVWAVGIGAMVVHWDGKVWQRIPVPTGSDLLAIWGSGARDMWSVGRGGTVVHWDGTRWSRTTTPVPDSAALNDVWGTSASDVWAVGDSGVLIHFDGTSWSMVSVPSINDLLTVWASSPNDAWIGGDLGMMMHWDGSGWTEVASVNALEILQIRGTAANKVWLTRNSNDVWRWDGTSWTSYGSVNGTALWMSGDNDVWVYNSSGGQSYHWNGTMWSGFYLSSPYTAIWSSSVTNAWTITGSAIFHYSGSWSSSW